jgi:hypothetical protein
MSIEELQDMGFRRVPFENVRVVPAHYACMPLTLALQQHMAPVQVHDLVGLRKVFLSEGSAFVPSDYLCSVITPFFRQKLSHSLVMSAGRWASTVEDQENDRLAPILRSLAKKCEHCHAVLKHVIVLA